MDAMSDLKTGDGRKSSIQDSKRSISLGNDEIDVAVELTARIRFPSGGEISIPVKSEWVPIRAGKVLTEHHGPEIFGDVMQALARFMNDRRACEDFRNCAARAVRCAL
jgi:hypothetical protein